MRGAGWWCAGLLALGGCGAASREPPRPTPLGDPVAAFDRVCLRPETHGALVAAGAALHWSRLPLKALPEEIAGNGLVDWTDVWAGPEGGPPMRLAVGRSGGTSYCRVYFERAAGREPPAQAVAELDVLGAPLGSPDFHGRPPAADGPGEVIGWHRGGRRDWRAVHVTLLEGATALRAPYRLEATRPLA